jgi:excisionase family DNA binding protein
MNDNNQYGASDRRYTVPEACKRIGLKTTALYAHIRKGTLVARKLGRRTYVFESDIQAFLRNTPTATVDATAKPRKAA